MGRTFIRQDAQIRNSVSYDDTLAAGSTLETSPTNIEADLNAARSQLKRAIYADAAGDWFADIPTVNSKKRAISALNTDLDDIEEKRLLFRAQVLTDIVIPASVAATGTLTATANFSNGDTVTTGTKTYTFQTVLTNVDGNVLIGATASDSLDNLIAAINLGAGSGTLYAAATTANGFVSAAAGAGDTMDVTALIAGAVGNVIATTETSATASWGGATLSGGAGDIKVLSVASSETPTVVRASGATTNGAVTATSAYSAAAFSSHELVEIAGVNAIAPKNLCVVRDSTTGQMIQSSGRDIYALLQGESTGADNTAFNDTSGGNRAKLSFVRMNAALDDLEACPVADIAGKTINYIYVRRINFDAIPEQAFLGDSTFVDQSASVDVTLNNAIDNQSGPATQVQDIDWRISDTFILDFQTSDGGVNLLRIMPNAAGDEIELNLDTLDVNTTLDSDFSQGASFDTGGTAIRVGVTAGYVDTAASDLGVRAGLELYLDDANQTGSTWAQTAGIKLSDTTAEWDAYETAFGEVSLLAGIVAAYNASSRTRADAAVSTAITANTLIEGPNGPGAANIDADLVDYRTKNFVLDVEVFVNGQLMRNGANAAANHDVYPSAVSAEQEFGCFYAEFALVAAPGNPDQISMFVN